MEELIYKLNGVRMLDVVEEEMIQLWLRNDTIPYLLKEDEEFEVDNPTLTIIRKKMNMPE